MITAVAATVFGLLMSIGDPCQPFSANELYAALRLGLPDAEARAVAEELTSSVDSVDYEQMGIPAPNPRELCWALPEDLLILLSLVSAELNLKVERFRAEFWRGHGALGPAEWTRRRNELREALIREGKLPRQS